MGLLVLPISKPVLDEQSRESRGEFEVFETKVPNELIALIGIPLLILLLLQLISTSIYLLKNPVDLGVDQASQWSLMLKGVGFFAFGLSTMCILPAAAAVTTFFCATPETWYRVPLWLTTAIAVCILSIIATVRVNMLRSRVSYNTLTSIRPSGNRGLPDGESSGVEEIFP